MPHFVQPMRQLQLLALPVIFLKNECYEFKFYLGMVRNVSKTAPSQY